MNDGDIQVFLDSIAEQPYAIQYTKPIVNFTGKKERALILNNYDKSNKNKLKDFNTVILDMLENQNFDEICVVRQANLPADKSIKNDFAIVGGFAVGTFQGGNKTASVSLKQRFGHEKIEKAKNDWKTICEQAEWNSNMEISFSQFVRQNWNCDIEE